MSARHERFIKEAATILGKDPSRLSGPTDAVMTGIGYALLAIATQNDSHDDDIDDELRNG